MALKLGSLFRFQLMICLVSFSGVLRIETNYCSIGTLHSLTDKETWSSLSDQMFPAKLYVGACSYEPRNWELRQEIP